MEYVILTVCGVIAGWAISKTGEAMRMLRAQQRDQAGAADPGGGNAAGAFVEGSSIAHDGFGHGHGDCGGHGHGGDCGGGHGGW
jgi:hypothetical protein